MKIDLDKFCSFGPERINTSSPFNIGKHTYATNGEILVRVPLISGYGESPIGDVPLELRWDFFDLDGFISIPDYPSVSRKCSICNGTGKTKICPECRGIGQVELENGFNVYWIECKSCQGDGVVPGNDEKCITCRGSGLFYPTPSALAVVNDIGVAYNYLDLIKDLDCVKINLHIPVGGPFNYYPYPFIFDGGCGFIMPIRL